MNQRKKQIKIWNEQKADEYYCCARDGFLFHDYTDFLEFIDINDDISIDES